MLKLKKLVLAITLVLVITTAASAFVPLAYVAAVVGPELAPYVTASLAIHGAALVAGLYYYLKPGAQSQADTQSIKTPSSVTWIDLPSMTVQEKDINTEITFDDFVNNAYDNVNKYPLLNQLVTKYSPPPMPVGPQQVGASVDPAQFIGKKVPWKENGHTGWVQITGVISNVTYGSGNTPYSGQGMYNFGSNTYYAFADKGESGRGWGVEVSYVDTTPPPFTKAKKSNSEVIQGLTVNGNENEPVKPTYQDEIKKMMQDPSYVPVFSDATTGLPHAPPPLGDIATPKQVSDYNKAGQNSEAQAAASAANAAAIAAAQTAANNANARSANAQAAASANPSDPNLAAAAAAAQAAADAANAALAKALADKAGLDASATQKQEDESAAEVPTSGTKKTIDMSKLHELKGALDSTYPFNLPGVIAGYYHKFVAPAETPVFDLPLPLGQTLHVDLSVMEPIAILFRYLIGISATAGALFYVVHFFRGIS